VDGVVASVAIGDRRVGRDAACFVIAEAGVNHNGSAEIACRLADVARAAGADAVKFQTFKADKLATIRAPKAAYQMETTSSGESQFDMLRALELSDAAHQQILAHCQRSGILFLSSPFDEDSADMLDGLGVPAFKISSGELTNLTFLAHVAQKSKPIILSTGMSRLSEVEQAVSTIRLAGNTDVILLQCVTNYPAAPADVNLRAMATMAEAFQVPVGYSDHTLGNEVAFAAVALGACVVEKHFTLDRNQPGPDHKASIEPEELAALIRGIRTVEAALGTGRKEPASSEAATAAVARRSLVAAATIPSGAILTDALVTVRRPGTGLSPSLRGQVVGRRARVVIPEGTIISIDMLS
jgi:N,N'-diacetyllegionaminate synthase